MSAFVVVAARAGEPEDAVKAYAYGNVQAILPTRSTYFGGDVWIWQVPDMRAAENQADRLASGMRVAVAVPTLLEAQTQVQDWRALCA